MTEAGSQASASDSASLFLMNVALEVAARAVATVGLVGHGVHAAARPVVHVVLRPPLVPTALQPATLLGGLARGGSQRRPELLRELADAINEAIAIVDLNAIITRLDLEAAINRVDLARLTTELIAEIDLPEIIRESTGAVASETLRGVRMQSHSGDDAIARAVARLRRRGQRPAVRAAGRDRCGRACGNRDARGRRYGNEDDVTLGGVSPVPREARPFQGETAGVVSRLIANVIDGVVVALVLVGGYLGFNGVLFLVDPRGFQFTGASLFASVATASVAMLLYFTATWATTGRTYGDHVMGLRVVNRHLQRVRPLPALIRAVLCVIFPIGLLWCAVSRSRRSVQDLLLRTSVVYEWLPRHDLAGSRLLPDVPEARA